MKNAQPYRIDCAAAAALVVEKLEGRLDAQRALALDAHLAACTRCHAMSLQYAKMHSLMLHGIAARGVSDGFDERSNRRLQERRAAIEEHHTTSAALTSVRLGLDPEEVKVPAAAGLAQRFGAAPWWAVSVSLHVLAILLASLVTMTIGEVLDKDEVIVVTNIEKRPEAKLDEPEKEKPTLRDILESKVDVQATDSNSTEQSNIVVPPDILAKAEIGDHFETINPDRPDTQSAFGNPDARMFHSVEGNDEPEGGGGSGGNSLMDSLIGVGGSASPGTGGGWGGGNGTGTGVGTGSGHGSFGSRNGGGRKLMVMRHGGSKATESAVDAALAWLARHQEADGHWDTIKHGLTLEATYPGTGAAGDQGITGLATLSFLGAGHTEKVGKYKDNVRRAVAWLRSKQQANGCLFDERGFKSWLGYCHAVCGLALAEAAGMSRVPETVQAAQKAVDYSTEIHQCGEGSDRRGWRYAPKSHGDTTVSGWFIMQIKSAKMAGLKVDPRSFEGAAKFLDTTEAKGDPNDPYGGNRYGYTSPDPTYRLTAIGVLGRQFLGAEREKLQGGIEWAVKTGGLPKWGPNGAGVDFYFWYYGTLCVFQQGGDLWKQWNEHLKSALVPNQRKGGVKDGSKEDVDGSWDPVAGRDTHGGGHVFGRVYSTAMATLCLEIYYRYLPMYR